MALMPVAADVYPTGWWTRRCQAVGPLVGAPPREFSPLQLIDVRSPVEVARGALPGAVSLPLLTDEERHLVGLEYRTHGQAEAVKLGYALVGSSLEGRIDRWQHTIDHADAPTAIACWRGGLRSNLVTRFVARAGVAPVEGGYRALRRHLISELPSAVARKRVVVLAGLTGAGKTRLLEKVEGAAPRSLQVIDLEGLARHRGSAFGHRPEPQPSQQTFENAIAAQIVTSGIGTLLIEDESRYVGRRTLPDALMGAMRSAPVLFLETDLTSRALGIQADYVAAPTAARGVAAVAAELLASLEHLRRRIGGALHDELAARIASLAADGAAWHEAEAHVAWIAPLLSEHYDPLYHRALAKLQREVVFRGSADEIAAWLGERYS